MVGRCVKGESGDAGARRTWRIDVANPAQDDTSDLMADFMAIVYSSAVRMYGLRSAKHRTNRVKLAMTAPVDMADDPT